MVAGTTWTGLEVLKQVTRLTGTQNSLDAVYNRAFDMWNTTSASTVAASGLVEAGSGEPTVLPGDDACIKSVVLLTDATLDYVTATQTAALIKVRNAEHNAALFFYSIEASVDVDGQAPKAMACSLDGVWGAIPSKKQHEQHTSGANPDSLGYSYSYSHYLASFTKYYEIKLATASAGYTVWSEPYLFDPSNLLGTTGIPLAFELPSPRRAPATLKTSLLPADGSRFEQTCASLLADLRPLGPVIAAAPRCRRGGYAHLCRREHHDRSGRLSHGRDGPRVDPSRARQASAPSLPRCLQRGPVRLAGTPPLLGRREGHVRRPVLADNLLRPGGLPRLPQIPAPEAGQAWLALRE